MVQTMIIIYSNLSSTIILNNTGGCPCVCLPCVVRHEFYISLALPISPEKMHRFRCLNDRIEVPDMIKLFAVGATTPMVVKI